MEIYTPIQNSTIVISWSISCALGFLSLLRALLRKSYSPKKKKGIEIELLHNFFFFFKDSFDLQRPLLDNCSLSSDPKSHIQPQEISTVELT